MRHREICRTIATIKNVSLNRDIAKFIARSLDREIRRFVATSRNSSSHRSIAPSLHREIRRSIATSSNLSLHRVIELVAPTRHCETRRSIVDIVKFTVQLRHRLLQKGTKQSNGNLMKDYTPSNEATAGTTQNKQRVSITASLARRIASEQ